TNLVDFEKKEYSPVRQMGCKNQ
ncbi:MAG: hypothetical protein H6Q48_1868, partial [Deltaproteobacteria bacterium]|nr:hypothetical protein [Deltaproteobacteria bacterium]